MPTKTALLASLQAVQDEILQLAASLTENERSESGPADNWGPRDILAHLAQNRRYLAEDLAASRRGEKLPQNDHPERTNQAVYERYAVRPWDEIARLIDESHRELEEQLQAFTDEELNKPDLYEWLNGAPLWRRLAGQSFIHATVHLAQYYIARGDLDAGRRLARLEKEQGLALDDSDRWLGMVHYNQGCYHALLGEKDAALRELERGFRLSPQFIEFSQQDTDLVSLHSDPDFKQLQESLKPVE